MDTHIAERLLSSENINASIKNLNNSHDAPMKIYCGSGDNIEIATFVGFMTNKDSTVLTMKFTIDNEQFNSVQDMEKTLRRKYSKVHGHENTDPLYALHERTKISIDRLFNRNIVRGSAIYQSKKSYVQKSAPTGRNDAKLGLLSIPRKIETNFYLETAFSPVSSADGGSSTPVGYYRQSDKMFSTFVGPFGRSAHTTSSKQNSPSEMVPEYNNNNNNNTEFNEQIRFSSEQEQEQDNEITMEDNNLFENYLCGSNTMLNNIDNSFSLFLSGQ